MPGLQASAKHSLSVLPTPKTAVCSNPAKTALDTQRCGRCPAPELLPCRQQPPSNACALMRPCRCSHESTAQPCPMLEACQQHDNMMCCRQRGTSEKHDESTKDTMRVCVCVQSDSTADQRTKQHRCTAGALVSNAPGCYHTCQVYTMDTDFSSSSTGQHARHANKHTREGALVATANIAVVHPEGRSLHVRCLHAGPQAYRRLSHIKRHSIALQDRLPAQQLQPRNEPDGDMCMYQTSAYKHQSHRQAQHGNNSNTPSTASTPTKHGHRNAFPRDNVAAAERHQGRPARSTRRQQPTRPRKTTQTT